MTEEKYLKPLNFLVYNPFIEPPEMLKKIY
jgi:hypothetical protein